MSRTRNTMPERVRVAQSGFVPEVFHFCHRRNAVCDVEEQLAGKRGTGTCYVGLPHHIQRPSWRSHIHRRRLAGRLSRPGQRDRLRLAATIHRAGAELYEDDFEPLLDPRKWCWD